MKTLLNTLAPPSTLAQPSAGRGCGACISSRFVFISVTIELFVCLRVRSQHPAHSSAQLGVKFVSIFIFVVAGLRFPRFLDRRF
jgi:hypothetical protein